MSYRRTFPHLSSPRQLPVIAALAMIACGSTACSDDDTEVPPTGPPVDDQLPVGWSEASHGNSAAPDYDVVFPTDVVQRLDIVITAEDFAAMTADVEDYVAETGGGGPPDGPPSSAAYAACSDLSENDACEYEDAGATIAGTCRMDPHQNKLVCIEGGSGSDRDPIYVPATLHYDERTWPHVGIRYKGNSSLRFSWEGGIRKLPFRLELDEYEDAYPTTKNQRFYGFKELTFAPGYFDPSYLHDTLALEIFEHHGVPTPARAFWTIYVDVGDGAGPTYWGLYTMIEDPSDAMMETIYGDESGNLYKPERGCANFTCFDEASFVKKTNEDEADYADVQALVAALYADPSDAAAWRADLEALFDVSGFLRWLAISTMIVNWDSYGLASHNYYLYARPDAAGRLTWIPWDHNMSLAYYRKDSLSLGMSEVDEQWPLIRFVLDDPHYAAIYRDEVAAAVTGPLAIDTFSQRAAQLHELIAPYVEQEKAPYTQLQSLSEFEQSVTGTDGLVDHATSRHADVQTWLGQN